MAAGDQLGILNGMQVVVPHVPVVGAGLVHPLGKLKLGDDAAEQVQAVQDLQLGAGAVLGQDGHKLVANAFGSHPFQQRRVLADKAGSLRFQHELEPSGQTGAAKETAGVVAEDLVVHHPDTLAGHVRPSAKGVHQVTGPQAGRNRPLVGVGVQQAGMIQR